MSIPIPNARPDSSWDLLKSRLEKAGHNVASLLSQRLFVVAVRGLFSITIGKPGNDINAYDDGIYVVRVSNGQPTVTTFNGNTDSTRYGWNAGAGKYMANLKPGSYWMKKRMHRGKYWAFGQCDRDVVVDRIDSAGKVRATERGQFGIDLHPGGAVSTSSEGCQTVPREQWDALYRLITETVGDGWFPYVLLAGD